MDRYFFSFIFIRLATLPMVFMPYKMVHAVGRCLGKAAYYLIPKFRKRALSNLALASDLNLSEEEIVRLAKESFCNLMITCLEYAKLAKEKDISRLASCENPEEAAEIMKSGKGVIFFCGHQANWEILFLEGTSRMPGVAIGRPIKNQILYDFVTKIRQSFGGKMIEPKQAAREGLRALKKGAFLGIVGDQGMPDSGFSCPFLGRMAWTSPMPALLAYRTGCPILVATTKRKEGKYFIRYSKPIWPDASMSMEKEVDRMMREALSLFAASVKENPGEWLWQHNRWKQQTPEKLKRRFRHESILIILPEEKEEFERASASLKELRALYPNEFLTVLIPRKYEKEKLLPDAEVLFYCSEKEVLLRDFRFKLVFNFSSFKRVEKHFLSLSAFEVVQLHGTPYNFSQRLCHAR